MIDFVKRAVVAVTMGFVVATAASACDAPVYKKVVCYENVTTVETVQVPYQKPVTRYDDCGRCYTAYVTCYKTVEVSVTRKVPVVKWVKVCDRPSPAPRTT